MGKTKFHALHIIDFISYISCLYTGLKKELIEVCMDFNNVSLTICVSKHSLISLNELFIIGPTVIELSVNLLIKQLSRKYGL